MQNSKIQFIALMIVVMYFRFVTFLHAILYEFMGDFCFLSASQNAAMKIKCLHVPFSFSFSDCVPHFHDFYECFHKKRGKC